MGRFIIRILLNGLGLWLAVTLLAPHIQMQNNVWYAYLILGLIFAVINLVVRPILMAISIPLIIVTLGLGTLVINTLMFLLVGWIGTRFSYGFSIPSSAFGYAFLGALIVSLVNLVFHRLAVQK
jgi:putative membrane protein